MSNYVTMNKEKNHKILITGGSGYVGRVFLDLFQNQCVLSSIDNEYVGNSNFERLQNVSYFKDDIRNNQLLEKLILENDVIVHLAGIVGDSCPKNPSVSNEINVSATKKIAEFCKKYDKRLVFMSTCSVYGFNEDMCSEETKPNPLNIYSEQKIKGEEVIREIDCNYLIFRMGTVYGWSPRMRFDLGINMFIEKYLWDEPIQVYGGNQYRPLIHVKDAAKALFMATEKFDINGIMNLVGENYKLIDIAKSISSKIEVVDHKDDNRSYIVNNSLIKTKLNWSPKMSINDAIKEFDKVNFQDKIYFNRLWDY